MNPSVEFFFFFQIGSAGRIPRIWTTPHKGLGIGTLLNPFTSQAFFIANNGVSLA
jgi:hypothetical protein